jgi:hypothetical protein
MTVAPQAETEVVTGTIKGIIDKGGGKYQVAVQPDGSQDGYTRNLWTKDTGLVGQLSQMVGQRTGFLCGVSHWNMQDGTPVRSLWINGVGQGMQQAPQQVAPLPQPVAIQPQAQAMIGMQPQAQPMQQPQAQPVATVQQPTEQTSRWLQEKAVERPYIHRQTATKVAAMLISHLPAEQRTFDNLISISDRLCGYYERGSGTQQPEYTDESGGPGGPDDGIPF